jgi:hypothetical protein
MRATWAEVRIEPDPVTLKPYSWRCRVCGQCGATITRAALESSLRNHMLSRRHDRAMKAAPRRRSRLSGESA